MKLTFEQVAVLALAEMGRKKHFKHTPFTKSIHEGRVPVTCMSLYRYSEESNVDLLSIFWYIDQWWSAYEAGSWCTRCLARPRPAHNHRLCSKCSKISVSYFELSGGGLASRGKSQFNKTGHTQSKRPKP